MAESESQKPVEWLRVGPPAASLVEPVGCDLFALTLSEDYVAAARLFQPNPCEGAVVYLHGIQSHGGWFLLSCDHLRQQGFTVLAPDRRGSGLNINQRGHADSSDQLIDDLDRTVDWLIENTGQQKVHLIAVSWSGKLALAYAARFQHKLRSVALVGPGLKARVDISLSEKIAVGLHGAIHPHKLHSIPLNDPNLFTQNHAKIQFIEQDPLKLTQTTAGFLITSHRLDALAKKAVRQIHVPVYLFLAEYDRIIDNHATIELLHPALRPVSGSNGPAKTYPGAHHTLDFETDPRPYFDDLVSSLKNTDR